MDSISLECSNTHGLCDATLRPHAADRITYTVDAVIAAVRFTFHESFQSPLQQLSVLLRSEQTRWRELPTGGVDLLLRDLRVTNRNSYLKALRNFSTWAIQNEVQLDTATQIDAAVNRYHSTASRSQAETLLCALIRVYPPLRVRLPWSHARLRTISAAQHPQHHAPLSWPIMVDVAYALVCLGYPRRAGLLVSSWRFGLRPMGLVQLASSDLYGRYRDRRSTLPAFVSLGTARGTKVSRRQVARVHQWDTVVNYLVDLFLATTPWGARLSDISSYRYLSHWLTVGLRSACYGYRYTPHCLRSGWTTWRFFGGQPTLDLMADGRWKSKTSLRVYLDAVTAADTMQDPHMISRASYLAALETTITQWLGW